ncbi:MAG: efflux RND transporter periplasmic adaptor subunit [Thermodesulfobacteriota bacterium]
MNLLNKKSIIIFGIVLVIGFLILPRIFSGDKSKINYVTSKVDRNNISSQILTTGTINPLTTIDVGTQIEGTVANVFVDHNSLVNRGDQLAELLQEVEKKEVKKAEADKRKAEAEYEIARSLFTTNDKLYKKRLISKEEYDDSKSKYNSALSTYEQSKVALDLAELNLTNTVIRSTIDGIVLSRNVNVGQKVVPKSLPPLFVIAEDMSKMKIDTNLSEIHIGKVKEGQNVLFTVDAYPNEKFEGTISEVRNNPVIVNNVVNYNVVVLTDNEDLRLKPGMTAEVNIILADKKDVLRIPTAALRYIPPPSANIDAKPDENSNASYVWIPADRGRITAVSVKPGESDSIYTEILESDLKEGQEVIVESNTIDRSGNSNSYLPQPGRF